MEFRRVLFRSDRISPSQAHAPVALQDQLPLTDELTHGARHFRFTLDLLDIKILGVLVGPVIGVHRLAERFRGRLPVAVMVAIAMRARLALPGDGIELLGHPLAFPHLLALLRSEEHTSELQSLMRISSAVFCLKKKTKIIINYNIKIYQSNNHNYHYT